MNVLNWERNPLSNDLFATVKRGRHLLIHATRRGGFELWTIERKAPASIDDHTDRQYLGLFANEDEAQAVAQAHARTWISDS
jgi:hypothetical protein